MHVRHEVDVPRALPHRDRRIDTRTGSDACVRAHEVEPTVLRLDATDERPQRRRVRDIELHGGDDR